jgi:hypothetical protein
VRFDLLDVVQLAEPILDRFHHQTLDVLRLGAGIDHDDLVDRDREVRVLLPRNAAVGGDAERHQHRKRDDRELIPPDREFEQVHCRPP